MGGGLRSSWLGHWKAPWGLDRGRRFGDAAWAAAALAQAWLLGGDRGRWPVATWTGRRPEGPCPAALAGATASPDPTFVALLRHGSAAAPAALPGKREEPLLTWAWSALLAGDAGPWMAAAPALFDLPTRLAWIPCLAAVEAGALRLPPFLAPLLPACLASPLPEGWAEALIATLDAEGRLLPAGDPPFDLPFDRLRPHLEPLLLPELPPDLEAFRGRPWLTQLEGAWMVDPRIRAWARGFGLSPRGLEPFRPRGLAFGDAPTADQSDLLQGRLPACVPEGWAAAVRADLDEAVDRPPPPPPCGEPTWDRLRLRWTGEAALALPGYPAAGVGAHPCADPFHWMAEGQRALAAQEMETSLRAFTLAHAHFARLGAAGWAQRAAANACHPALLWGDLPALRAWLDRRGPQPEPWDAQWKAFLIAAEGELERAGRLAGALAEAHPGFVPAWSLRAELGVAVGRADWVREALPHIPIPARRAFLEAWLQPEMGPCPADADDDTAYLWAVHRAARGEEDGSDHWARFQISANRLACLLGGLHLLERRPDQRRPDRLLALQELVDRAGSEAHRSRMQALWPSVSAVAPEPEAALRAWLEAQAGPLWLVWGRDGLLGHGEAPPPGLMNALRQGGAAPAVAHGGKVWWSLPWPGRARGWAPSSSPRPRARPSHRPPARPWRRPGSRGCRRPRRRPPRPRICCSRMAASPWPPSCGSCSGWRPRS